jgi:NADPH:quinone reductase-like Zn-dependent oxidoreductase
MRAVQYSGYGEADVLATVETDRPVAGPGQVLVQVAGTSFNPVDVALRAGWVQQAFPLTFPHVPGFDVAGTVAALGDGVSGFTVGDTVVGFLPMDADGAAAEFVAAPAAVLTAAPAGIPLADAAALPSAALTAWQALFEHAGLQAGQRLLVAGAGGAVGGYAVQLAARAGAVVVATVSPRSAEQVRRQGADQLVDHTTTRVGEAVTEPVDVVLDLVGADRAELLELVRPGGVYVTTVPPAPEAPEGVRVAQVFVRSDADLLARLVTAVDAGELTVDVAERLPLTELADVHRRSAAGTLRGKVVLVP